MGSDVGQIFPTASLHRDHSILYAVVCEKEFSHMGTNSENPDLVCKKKVYFFSGEFDQGIPLLHLRLGQPGHYPINPLPHRDTF